MRLRLLLATSITFALGCQGGPGGAPAGVTPKPKASAGATKAVGLRDGDEPRFVDAAAASKAGKPLVAATLIGKIRLISDNGAALISDSGGTIISNNGGALIGKIRGEGAGLIGKIRYRTTQAAAPEEAYLADARVEVLDAQGRVLVDEAGKPIAATSDKQGGYRLGAQLPDENLTLRVALDPSLGPDGKGGTLLAILPRGGGDRTLGIDTASSVGAGFVLERLVKSRQAVYDLLPGTEAEALQAEVEAARGLLPLQPAYSREALAAAAEALAAKSAPVQARLERIRAILLAGQSDLGRGLLATEVALAAPVGIAREPGGALYVVEAGSFRVRKVGTDGRIAVHAGTGAGKAKVASDSIEPIGSFAMAPDGTIYLSQPYSNRVRTIAPDGTLGLLPTSGLVRPAGIAIGPDGTVAVGEAYVKNRAGGVYLLKDGRMTAVPLPGGFETSFIALAFAPDGTLWALDELSRKLLRRRPGEAGLTVVAADLAVDRLSGLACDAAGTLYLAESTAHRIVTIGPAAQRTVVAGTGTAGHAGEGGAGHGGPAQQAGRAVVPARRRPVLHRRRRPRAPDRAGRHAHDGGWHAERAHGRRHQPADQRAGRRGL